MEQALNESQPQVEEVIVENRENEENQEAFKLDQQNIRLGFIRKVYLILSTQLALTALLIAISVDNDGYRVFVRNNLWLFVICIVVALASLFTLICFRSVSRAVPWNYILLGLFTLSEAYLASCITAFAPPQTVLIAATLTAVVTVALTVYAFTTKSDFTILGGVLFVASAVLLVAFIIVLFTENRVLEIIISSLICIVYGIYLIYDTQLIVGKQENALSFDDYIQGALHLFIDIFTIFIHLLQIFAGGNN